MNQSGGEPMLPAGGKNRQEQNNQMKKFVVFVLLLSLLCALFAGCTEKKPEGESENVSLPSMNVPESRENEIPDTTGASETVPGTETRENGEEQQNTDPAPTEAESTEQPSATTEEPDPEETGTEYIVDGGNGFGFGGN